MAKRFRFRLEPLLTLRKRREDQQQRVVAQRLAQLQRSRELLRDLHRRVDDTVVWARQDRRREQLDVGSALQEQRWRWHLQRRIVQQREEIEDIQTGVHEERAELARRSKDRKAIQKLRERQQAEHLANQARQERMEMDEFASQMHQRTRSNRCRPSSAAVSTFSGV